MDMILIIEDDAYIEIKSTFNSVFRCILYYLKENIHKWKIFHGGPSINKYSQISEILSQEPLLFNISQCILTTFIIYNSSTYDFFLKYYTYNDEELLHSSCPIDNIIFKNFTCTTTYPCLIWQINSFSIICNRYRKDLEQIK